DEADAALVARSGGDRQDHRDVALGLEPHRIDDQLLVAGDATEDVRCGEVLFRRGRNDANVPCEHAHGTVDSTKVLCDRFVCSNGIVGMHATISRHLAGPYYLTKDEAHLRSMRRWKMRSERTSEKRFNLIVGAGSAG